MKHCITTICLTILIISAVQAQPDSLWTRTYGGAGADSAFCVQPTADGGFIAVGGTDSYGAGWSDILLLKTDSDGDTLWSRIYGGIDSDFARCVRQTADGGYIVAGGTYSYGGGEADIYLIRTDSIGDTLWTFTYGDTLDETAYSVVEADDGGFVVAGYYYGFFNTSSYFLLMKVDSGGDFQWVNPISNWGFSGAHCIDKTSDGGYIATGYTGLGYTNGGEVFLVKIDDEGRLVWEKTIGGTQTDIGNSVRQTRDGGFIAAATTHSFGAGYSDFYLIRTDPSGDTLWTKTFGGPYEELGQSVIECPDGGFIIAGTTFSYSGLTGDIMLVKTDSGGDSLWSMIIGGAQTEEGAYYIQRAQDGGFVTAGYTGTPQNPDLYLLRFQSETQVFLTITPGATPINVPSSGGDVTFRVNIVNSRQTAQVFDVWAQLTLPNGRILLPAFLRTGLTLQAGENLIREITHTLPPSAPGGNYFFRGSAGVYPDSVYSSDRFYFIKLPGENMSTRNPDGLLGTGAQSGFETERIILSASPNPFNASTAISFKLQAVSHIRLSVYDITGREVARLIDGWLPEGNHSMLFYEEDLASGVYFAKLEVGSIKQVRKLLLVK